VLLNLLVNATEAIDETGDTGAGKITLQTAHADGRIAVTVVDNAVGFDPVGAASMFDPFVTTKAEGDGDGPVDQSHHRGGPRRAAVGHAEPRGWRHIPSQPARPSPKADEV